MKAQRQFKTTSDSIQSLEAFYEAAKPFVAQYNNWLEQHGDELTIIPDHICYKCSSSQEFERMRQLFEKEGTYLFQSFISGRRIAIIKLYENIGTRLDYIRYLELSDQKPDGSQVGGFDHIEVYPDSETVESLVRELAKNHAHFQINKRDHHTTHDLTLEGGFKIRIEPEPLIEKIKRDEMR